MKKTQRTVLWIVFAFYVLLLLFILFLSRPPMTWYSVPGFFRRFTNLIPFKTIIEYIRFYSEGLTTVSVRNLAANLFMFVPMGALLPCLFKRLRRFWKVLVAMLVMVMTVELMQGLLRLGSVDIDDVIFNVLGAVMGYGIYKLPFVNKMLYSMGFVK